jgi:hypothetical protein
MHLTNFDLIAALFELKFAPIGPYRTVLHCEDFDETFHGPLYTSDMREKNADSAYKRRGAVAS